MNGMVLAGRYTLVEALGSAGRTWLARDTVLHRDVAVTRIPLPPGPPEAIEAVLAEPRAAAVINHPALVTLHDVLTENGEAWVVADYVRGRSLDRIVAATGPVSTTHAAEIGMRVLNALGVIHSRGRTHRAVVPANVLVADTGDILLAGLGLAPVDGTPADPADDLRALGATLLYATEARTPETGPPSEGPLAQPIHALLYGPHDTAAIRAAFAAAASSAAVPFARALITDNGPPTVPSGQAAPRGRGPLLAVAGAALAVAAAGAIALPLVLDRAPAAEPSATPAAAAATTPTARPRPSRPADPCTRLSASYRPSATPGNTCSVRMGDASVTIKSHPDEATARQIFAALRRRQAAKAGSDLIDEGGTSPIRNVRGIGDEGFAQDGSSTLFSTATSTVWLRIDTLTVEVQVLTNETRVTPQLRNAALRAARTVAAELAETA
ncbi:MAG: protein kinase [Actinomycetes bacterium]|jgi:serine/threonine protein kinase